VTAPVNPVVSTADMKAYLRIDTSDEDTLITAFVKAATLRAESYTGRKFITQTQKLVMDFFPMYQPKRFGQDNSPSPYHYLGTDKPIQLPFGAVQSVSSVKYYTSDNTLNTYSSSNYYTDVSSGRVITNDNTFFPTDLREFSAVEVEFVCGYGDDSTDVPQDIVEAVKQIAAGMYEAREVECEIPCCASVLLSSYKLPKGRGFLENGM
jgi:hypothetical protein